jgi:signal transduction histidine kinase
MKQERESDLTVAGIAHDLNNVFETISEAAEALGGDPKWGRLAATIQRSVDRGARIVDSFSENVRDNLEFGQILESAIRYAKDVLEVTQKVDLDFRRSVEPGLKLPGQPAAWERVLVNLFLNAAQAMRENRLVEVTAAKQEREARISVMDNGPGIPEEILPHVFEPRNTTRKRRSREVRSGLGLHIVQTIVSKNGGTVEASNRRNRGGAQFIIRVPLG